jgi:1,4-alpha-glucan branching enzyme
MLKKTQINNKNLVKVTFVLPADHPHARASVVGDFNDWDVSTNKLVKRSNNTYSTAVTLKKGKKYAFRYRTRDGVWFNDEAADAYVLNEHGSQNCIVKT